MAWFSLAKLALNAGTHIYKKRQETKMAMADAQHMHAKKMAEGQEAYQGKLWLAFMVLRVHRSSVTEKNNV
jgi:hypothetical protein